MDSQATLEGAPLSKLVWSCTKVCILHINSLCFCRLITLSACRADQSTAVSWTLGLTCVSLPPQEGTALREDWLLIHVGASERSRQQWWWGRDMHVRAHTHEHTHVHTCTNTPTIYSPRDTELLLCWWQLWLPGVIIKVKKKNHPPEERRFQWRSWR